MTKLDDLIDVARSYEGTRFAHHGRNPGGGLDCIGVVICAAASVGLQLEDSEYQRQPSPDWMIAELDRQFDRDGSLGRGRILLFECGALRDPMHLALQTGEHEMIHAYDMAFGRGGGRRRGRMVRDLIGRYWRERLYSTWRFRGI